MQRFYALFTFLVLFAVQLSAQSADCLNIYLTRTDTSSNDTVLLDVRVRNYANTIGLQYTTQWDTSVLQLLDVRNFGLPELKKSNFSFGSPNISKGLLSLSWTRLDSFYLPDGARLYSLLFVVKNKTAATTTVSFSNAPVPSEVVYRNNRSQAITGLIGLKLNLKSHSAPNPLRFTQICSAMNSCKDSLASASVSVSGGVPPYRYFWTGKGMTFQTANISSALPGDYQLWVSDQNRDTIPALVAVSVNAPGSGAIYLYSRVVCDDSSKQSATIIVSSIDVPGGYVFQWSNGFKQTSVNSSSIRMAKDSLYSLTVTDSNGCIGSLFGLSATNCYPVPQDTIPQDTIVYPDPFKPRLLVQSTIASTGEVFCTPVIADNFKQLYGLQFGLRWDPQALSFQRINYTMPNIIDINTLGLGNVTNGELRFVKVFSPSAIAFSGETLFEVCFTPKFSGDSTQITFGPGTLPPLAVDAQQNLIPFLTYGGAVITAPSIWPGDADGNGVVDQFDLLPLGLAYGTRGTARPNAQITWERHNTQKWGTTLINTNIDLAFVDADGNGQIDAADTTALARNWQREHGDGLPKLYQPEIRGSGASLFIDADTVLSGPGQWFPLELGTADKVAENVYGLAFSVSYDPAQVQETELSFSAESSWLGTLGQNLIAFQRNNPVEGRIDVALTRTDGRNVSGYGRIGKVKITIEDVILNLREEENPKIQLGIENVRLINNADQIIPVTPLPSTPTAKKGLSTSVYDPYLDARIRVYPQPARDQLFLDYGDLPLRSVQLLQIDGKALSGVLVPQRSLSLAGIPNGIYLLKVVAESGVVMKKVLVAR
ncbi:T9SS type A sorting domain-containing protein [Haliscomenobacter sp.]|uniref:T9SS type A sorting domain-containing protein n=1 Tax=Haliscomenobacter sp. TaxID=2717303 RepID=UPI003BA92643